jgi:hypothetical protein
MSSALRHLFGVLALGMFMTPVVSGQTRFPWPATEVDVATYTTVDECVAAARRMALGETKRERLATGVWTDTMPFDPQRRLRPLPGIVVQTASRCAARFVEPTAPLGDFDGLLELYLFANRDTDATALLTRRLAIETTDAGRASVVEAAFSVYVAAQPIRMDDAERALEQKIRLNREPPLERLRTYYRLLEVAWREGDTARARRIAQGQIARADSLPAPLRQSLETGGSQLVIAYTLLAQPALIDSLRRSTSAYMSLSRSIFGRMFGEQWLAANVKPLGDEASALAGDFWFRREPAGAPRPTRGRVNVVAFVDMLGCPDGCWAAMALLRRLAQRFPTVEITLATQTRGYFMSVALESPAEEAEWLRRWLLEGQRLPGALSVSTTSLRRLPAPDRRTLDVVVPNTKNYPRHALFPFVYLVDRNGVIVWFDNLRPSEEGRWVAMIEALLSQDDPSPR